MLALLLPTAAPHAAPLDDLSPQSRPAVPGDQGWRDVRVQVVAHNVANLGSPMSGRLAEFPLRDGDRFQQGQVLARFVCGEQEGQLAHAKALLGEKSAVLSTNTKLHNLGTGSGLDFQVAGAQAEEARAAVQIANAVLESCVVKAPFPGRVSSVSARPFQFIGVGQPLMEILDDRTLDLELIVPSRWLSWMAQGTPFAVTVEETGRTYKAAIDRISGKVDAVSQSVKIYGRLTDPAPELLAGMSGKALLEPPAR